MSLTAARISSTSPRSPPKPAQDGSAGPHRGHTSVLTPPFTLDGIARGNSRELVARSGLRNRFMNLRRAFMGTHVSSPCARRLPVHGTPTPARGGGWASGCGGVPRWPPVMGGRRGESARRGGSKSEPWFSLLSAIARWAERALGLLDREANPHGGKRDEASSGHPELDVGHTTRAVGHLPCGVCTCIREPGTQVITNP